MSFPIYELAGYPKESGGQGQGNAATRAFLVPWPNRMAFIAMVAGGAQPAAYPDMPHCRLQSWSCEPASPDLVPSGTVTDPATQIQTYAKAEGNLALVTFVYGIDFLTKEWPSDVPKPSVREDTQLRLAIRSGGQFLSIPARAAKFEDAPEGDPGPTEDMPQFILVAQADFQAQWDWVDDPPFGRLQNLLGKVNEDEFLGCPPETLLFESYQEDDSFRPNPLEPHTYRIALSLKYRRAGSKEVASEIPEEPPTTEHFGWNHDWFPGNPESEEEADQPGWRRVLLGDDQPRYKKDAFSELFT